MIEKLQALIESIVSLVTRRPAVVRVHVDQSNVGGRGKGGGAR